MMLPPFALLLLNCAGWKGADTAADTGYAGESLDMLYGEPGDAVDVGAAITNAGDIDGDGNVDMFVSAPSSSKAESEYGKICRVNTFAGDIPFSTSDSINGCIIAPVDDETLDYDVLNFGNTMQSIYPLGDEVPMIAARYTIKEWNAYYEEFHTNYRIGIYSAPDILGSVVPFATQDAVIGYNLGIFGSSFDGNGDMDGDGSSDMVVSTYLSVVNEEDRHLEGYYGTESAYLGLQWRIEKGPVNSVALGDVDGDGLDDVIAGAGADDEGFYDGAYDDGGTVGWINSSDIETLDGLIYADAVTSSLTATTETDNLGASVSADWDVDGDGLVDVVATAPHANDEAGAVYVLNKLATASSGSSAADSAYAVYVGEDVDYLRLGNTAQILAGPVGQAQLVITTGVSLDGGNTAVLVQTIESGITTISPDCESTACVFGSSTGVASVASDGENLWIGAPRFSDSASGDFSGAVFLLPFAR